MDTHPRTRRREHRLALRRLYVALRSPPEIPSLAYEAPYTALLDHLRQKKEESMQEIYNILSITLGGLPLPDCPFTYQSEDKDEKARSWPGTPRQFYKQFSSEKGVHSLGVSLIRNPRNDYNRLYPVEKLGNVWSGGWEGYSVREYDSWEEEGGRGHRTSDARLRCHSILAD